MQSGHCVDKLALWGRGGVQVYVILSMTINSLMIANAKSCTRRQIPRELSRTHPNYVVQDISEVTTMKPRDKYHLNHLSTKCVV